MTTDRELVFIKTTHFFKLNKNKVHTKITPEVKSAVKRLIERNHNFFYLHLKWYYQHGLSQLSKQVITELPYFTSKCETNLQR